jgi:APA family basic amino acid/polyamine antiporter
MVRERGTKNLGGVLGTNHLLRVLGLAFGLAIGVGTMIGGGILRTPGGVLDQVPTPWLALLLWTFAGLHALLGANVVAEVMTAVPKSGGLFNAARRAFGEFGALLVGWTDLLIGIAAMAALAIACGEFFVILLPGLEPFTAQVGAAVALVLFALNWLGVRESSAVQMAMSAAKAVLLVALILLVVLVPPATAQTVSVPALTAGVSFFGIIVAYQLIVGAYSGWPNSAYFAEETLEPGRDIPRALFLSILTVMAVYIMMNAALLYVLPVEQLRTAELPVSVAVGNIFGSRSSAVVAAIAFIIVVGCLNANIMTSVRVFHGLGKEGFLPAITARVNRGGTPDVALVISGVATILLALTGEFETVFLILGALGLFTLALIDVALFKLRFAEPELPRPYRAAGYPFLPLLVLVLDVTLLIAFLAADPLSAVFMVTAVAICLPLAAIARRRRTRIAPSA